MGVKVSTSQLVKYRSNSFFRLGTLGTTSGGADLMAIRSGRISHNVRCVKHIFHSQETSFSWCRFTLRALLERLDLPLARWPQVLQLQGSHLPRHSLHLEDVPARILVPPSEAFCPWRGARQRTTSCPKRRPFPHRRGAAKSCYDAEVV